MRRKVKNRHQPEADRVYDSEKLAKFINYIMWDGKKNAAEKVVYGALDIVKEKTGVENPLEVFETALKNAGPTLEVRSRRIGQETCRRDHQCFKERRFCCKEERRYSPHGRRQQGLRPFCLVINF